MKETWTVTRQNPAKDKNLEKGEKIVQTFQNCISYFFNLSNMLLDQKYPVNAVPGPNGWHNIQTEIATYRQNQPRGQFSKNIYNYFFLYLCKLKIKGSYIPLQFGSIAKS